MRMFAVVFAICCLATAQARPGYHGGGGGGGHALQAIPDIGAYEKLDYPKYDIIELGEFSKGGLPPATIVSNKEITIKVPEPYPVKVPHPVPHPVPVPKPYPVYHTKIVKVPHPVPYEVVKKVPVPIEVPKPYPVPVNEHHGGGGGGGYGSGFGGSFGGHHALASEESYGGGDVNTYVGDDSQGGGEHFESDQSAGYAAYEQPENQDSASVQEEHQEETEH